MPDPPYSSGTIAPRRPSSPSFATVSRGNAAEASHSPAFGRTSFATNVRSMSRSACCSSFRTNSIPLLRGHEIDIGRLQLGIAAELRLHLHPDPDVLRLLRSEKPGKEERVDPVELDQDEVEGGLLQELLAAEIAGGEGVDPPRLRKLHPGGFPTALRARQPGCGISVVALPAPRPEQLLVGESREEGGVLPVGMDIFDVVRLLDDDRGHLLERLQVRRQRDVEHRRPGHHLLELRRGRGPLRRILLRHGHHPRSMIDTVTYVPVPAWLWISPRLAFLSWSSELP